MAPRISRHVLEAVFKRDDPRRPIAETYRQVAADAERLGYTRPSYEQIRAFVHRVRRINKQPTTTDILVDIALIRRHADELIDHWAGIGVRRLP
jgi:AraC-like DNA-binding protein